MAFVVEHTVATKYFIYIIPNENAVGNLGFFFFFFENEYCELLLRKPG